MYIDFNKKDMDLLEYRELVKQFLKKANKLHSDKYYFDEMVDFLCDSVQKKDLKYDNRSTLSTYRFIVLHSALSTYFTSLNRRKDSVHIGDKCIEVPTSDKSMNETIEDDEQRRVYDIAMSIIIDRMEDDIKYKCFYDWAILDKRKTEISKEVGVTKTCVGHYITKVREALKKELINYEGADICSL